MKNNKIFFILIAIILFISLFIGQYDVMSAGGGGVCCDVYSWTESFEVNGNQYWCCANGWECTPCIVVD